MNDRVTGSLSEHRCSSQAVNCHTLKHGPLLARAKPLMQLQSTLTCPKCQHRATETMPTDACQFFYDCKGCGERLKPLSGDCCVFCSYGSLPCPPIQQNGKGACCG